MAMPYGKYFFVIFFVLLLSQIECFKILFLSPIASKSHKNFFNEVIDALIENNHHLTVVSPFPAPKPNAKIEDVIIENFSVDSITQNVLKGDPTAPIVNSYKKGPQICVETMAQEKVQKLKTRKFDLIIFSLFLSDCYLSMIYEMQIPYIHIFPDGLWGTFSIMMGNPVFPSFAPELMLNDIHPLTFGQRIKSALLATFGPVINMLFEKAYYDKCVESGGCKSFLPSFDKIKSNGSALILNSIRTMERPMKPYNLNIIHAGGIHLKEPKPLPKDIEDWIMKSGDSGFIFFSLGSAVKASEMPEEYRNTLVEVFRSLKQTVLWKWDEENIQNISSNVKISKWFPQQDILAHPKLQLFITHGGLHSTQESIYHNVKVIGMPLFGDQQKNIAEVENDGWGKELKWDDLTAESLKSLIDEVIADENMKKRCKERSDIMRDQIRNPKEDVVYWIEYIIRHKGAKHLRSPILDLTWYELYNIDVWALIITVVTMFLFIQFSILIFCIKKCMTKVGLLENKKTKKE